MSSRYGTTARSSQNLGAAAPPRRAAFRRGVGMRIPAQRTTQSAAQEVQARTKYRRYTRIRAPCMRSRACGLCGLIAFRAKKARGPVGVLVPTPPGRFARVRTRRLPNMRGQAPVLLRPVDFDLAQCAYSHAPAEWREISLDGTAALGCTRLEQARVPLEVTAVAFAMRARRSASGARRALEVGPCPGKWLSIP